MSGGRWPGWPDARGWIGVGVFALSVMLLWMMFVDAKFREDEFVQTIATLIIGTGFVGGAVAWAYSSTKAGGELANQNATMLASSLGTQEPPPRNAREAAGQVADAAQERREQIEAASEPSDIQGA